MCVCGHTLKQHSSSDYCLVYSNGKECGCLHYRGQNEIHPINAPALRIPGLSTRNKLVQDTKAFASKRR